MKKILLISSLFSILLMAEVNEVEVIPNKTYLPEEIIVLKNNGMTGLDLEQLNSSNGLVSKEGLIIIEKSAEDLKKVNIEIENSMILLEEENSIPSNLSDLEKYKINILKENQDISEEDLEKFITFNYIGKISFAIERDIVFKGIELTDSKSKNKITKKEVIDVIKKELADKDKFIEDILSTFQRIGYDEVMTNYDIIIEQFSISFTDKEVKMIHSEIKKELDK